MNYLLYGMFLLAGVFAIFSYVLLIIILKVVNRVIETNKQLLIVVAGKEAKPEALRALIASAKPPQGKLKGIANSKKKDDKPANTNYTVGIGG